MGFFPVIPDHPDRVQTFLEVDTCRWENYRSVERDPLVCSTMLAKMVSNKLALSFSSTDAFSKHLGFVGIILNKLGLCSKIKPDGTMKHRLV